MDRERWEHIPQESFCQFLKPRTEHRFGIEVQVYVSVYDLPTDYRVYADDKKELLTIEFRYADAEPTELTQQEAVAFEYGEFTKRLRALHIQIQKLAPDFYADRPVDVNVDFFTPVEQMVSQSEASETNKRAAKHILKENTQELAAALR